MNLPATRRSCGNGSLVNALSQVLPCFALGALFFGCSSDTPAIPNARALDAGVRDSAVAADSAAGAVDSAVSIPSSAGSGGIACTSPRTVSGHTVCSGSGAGSQFRFVAPTAQANTDPLDLVVYIHGDGARAYTSDSALKALLPWADDHHAIALAVLAPNGCAWWQKPTQTNCSDGVQPDPDTTGVNADTLKSVLDAFRAHYNIRLDRTFFYGASGGSIFLTNSFFRRFGDTYPGAYALNCGGTKPALPFTWDTKDATRRGATKMFFTYGDLDFLKSEIELAIPYFKNAGFPVDTQIVPGAEHCAFDAHGRAVEVFRAFLGE